MANETEYSNYQTVAAYLAAEISPHFRSKVVMPNLMKGFNFQNKSDSIKLRKAGSVTATTATESTDHAVSEYTETSPNTLTAAEVKVYMEVSDKARAFGGADINALVAECGAAIAQKFDTDALALADALNGGTVVGTTTVDATPANLVEAAYIVRANNVPGPIAYVLHPAQERDVKDDIIASTGTPWSNTQYLDILGGQQPANNGFRGTFFDVPVYISTNTESLNTNADWGGVCLDVNEALAYGVYGDIMVDIGYNVKKGVTEIGVRLWYDIKEYNDTAGVAIVTDQ